MKPRKLYETIEEGRLLLDEAARAGVQVGVQNGKLIVRADKSAEYLVDRLFEKQFTVLFAIAQLHKEKKV